MFLPLRVYLLISIIFNLYVKGEDLRIDDTELYNTRIVGLPKDVTNITQYPYVVGIIRDMNGLVGTGVVTGRVWVLTSGQAVKTMLDAWVRFEYFVRSDSLDVSPAGNARTKRVIYVVPHPGYTSAHKLKNIGLVKVCPPFSSSVKAPLGQPPAVQAGQQGIVLAWGGTNLKKLRYLTQTIISDSVCVNISAVISAPKVYETQNFCVTINLGNATCIGDNGSPFIISGKVVGILDQYSCNNNTADTYTELLDYLPWITTTSATN